MDGGTSRFDKRGVVYQAVCASCGGAQGFPVPPGAGTYTARNGSTNCNNGAFKMNFEVLQADAGPRRYLCLDDGPVALGGTPGRRRLGRAGRAGRGRRRLPLCAHRRGAGPVRHHLHGGYHRHLPEHPQRCATWWPRPWCPRLRRVPPQCLSGAAVALAATPAGGTFSGPGVSGGRFDPAAAGAGTHTLTYTVCRLAGLRHRQPAGGGEPPARREAGRDTTLCADLRQPFQLRGFAPAGGVWSGTGVTATRLFHAAQHQQPGRRVPAHLHRDAGPCQATATRTRGAGPRLRPERGPEPAGVRGRAAVRRPRALRLPAGAGAAGPGRHLQLGFWRRQPPQHRGHAHAPLRAARHLPHSRSRPATATARCSRGLRPWKWARCSCPTSSRPTATACNETFQPRFSCRPASLEVYSRWGQRVYQTDDYHNDWDAAGLANGIYYYLLRDADDRRVKGWVEVRR